MNSVSPSVKLLPSFNFHLVIVTSLRTLIFVNWWKQSSIHSVRFFWGFFSLFEFLLFVLFTHIFFLCVCVTYIYLIHFSLSPADSICCRKMLQRAHTTVERIWQFRKDTFPVLHEGKYGHSHTLFSYKLKRCSHLV